MRGILIVHNLFTWHTDQGTVNEESQTHSSGEHTYTTKLPKSTTIRDDEGVSTAISEPTQSPGIQFCVIHFSVFVVL